MGSLSREKTLGGLLVCYQYFKVLDQVVIASNCYTLVRESKTFLDSGFHSMDFGFQVLDSGFFFSGTWIADFKRGEITLWYCFGGKYRSFYNASFIDLFDLKRWRESWPTFIPQTVSSCNSLDASPGNCPPTPPLCQH